MPPHTVEDLIACPRCDALYHAVVPPSGERTVCPRCETVLITPREGSYTSIVLLSATMLILLVSGTFLPFLQVEVAGLSNSASIFDAALAFSGSMAPLAVAVAALILGVPLLRMVLLIYVVGPLAAGRPPLPRATTAFRLSEDLRPWSMAEIFIIGVAVALTKVADLASVHLGAAFWMFAALVLVVVAQDQTMCRWSIWKSLETALRR